MNVPCLDSASGNRRLVCHSKSIALAGCLSDDLPCFNHQNFIGHSTTMLAVSGPDVLLNMFSASMFMNSGAHMLRCAMAVSDYLDGIVELRRGQAPSWCIAYAEEMKTYLLRWDATEARASSTRKAKAKASTKAKARARAQSHAKYTYKHAVETLFGLKLGGLQCDSDRLIVYTEEQIITVELRVELVNTIAEAVTDILFARMFPIPSCSKWTKSCPSIDRFIAGFFADLLPNITKRGCGKLTFATRGTGDDNEYEEMDGMVEWNKVTGKYANRTLKFFATNDDKAMIIIMGIVEEGFRYLALFYMTTGHCTKIDARSAISTLTNDRASPIYVVLQYYSAVLAGRSSRLKLILGFRGCSAVAQWRQRFAQDAMRLRQVVTSAAGVVERRQRRRLKQFPWPMFGWGDPRVSDDVKLQQIRLFANFRRCRLRPGFARDFFDKFADLEGEARVQAIMAWVPHLFRAGRILPVTIAPAENIHAGNRRRASKTGQTIRMHTLAATCVVAQTVTDTGRVFKAARDAQDTVSPIVDDVGSNVGAAPIDDALETKCYHRRQTAEQMHRADWIVEQQAVGNLKNPISRQAWKLWAEAWGRVSVERGKYYDALADCTGSMRGPLPLPLPLPLPSNEPPPDVALALAHVAPPLAEPPCYDDRLLVPVALATSDMSAMTGGALVKFDGQVKVASEMGPPPLDPALFSCIVSSSVRSRRLVPDMLAPYLEKISETPLGCFQNIKNTVNVETPALVNWFRNIT